MTPRRRVVLATTNPGKAREFAALLPPDIEVLTLDELGVVDVDERRYVLSCVSLLL